MSLSAGRGKKENKNNISGGRGELQKFRKLKLYDQVIALGGSRRTATAVLPPSRSPLPPTGCRNNSLGRTWGRPALKTAISMQAESSFNSSSSASKQICTLAAVPARILPRIRPRATYCFEMSKHLCLGDLLEGNFYCASPCSPCELFFFSRF